MRFSAPQVSDEPFLLLLLCARCCGFSLRVLCSAANVHVAGGLRSASAARRCASTASSALLCLVGPVRPPAEKVYSRTELSRCCPRRIRKTATEKPFLERIKHRESRIKGLETALEEAALRGRATPKQMPTPVSDFGETGVAQHDIDSSCCMASPRRPRPPRHAGPTATTWLIANVYVHRVP